MDMGLGLAERQIHAARERPRQVRVAAMVIVVAREQAVGVRVAARPDHVVHASAVGVEAVPVERVAGDGRHRPEVGQRAP